MQIRNAVGGQITQAWCYYSEWIHIVSDVLQGSIRWVLFCSSYIYIYIPAKCSSWWKTYFCLWRWLLTTGSCSQACIDRAAIAASRNLDMARIQESCCLWRGCLWGCECNFKIILLYQLILCTGLNNNKDNNDNRIGLCYYRPCRLLHFFIMLLILHFICLLSCVPEWAL